MVYRKKKDMRGQTLSAKEEARIYMIIEMRQISLQELYYKYWIELEKST